MEKPTGNGDNAKYISITCPYIVYQEEWEDVLNEIDRLLIDYKDGKYVNMIPRIEEALI